MSQLSKKIIFIIIFTILAIAITIGLIYYRDVDNETNTVVSDEENFNTANEVEEEEEETVAGIGIYDTYTQNALTITEESLGDNIVYEQIDGLKNTSLQNEINSKIKDKATEYYNEYGDEGTFSATVVANFSNVLSICFSQGDEDDDERYADEGLEGLNYNLVTGEKLTLSDMFVSESAAIACLRQELYEDLSWGYAETTNVYDDVFEYGLESVDYGEIEDRVYEFLLEYKKNDKFYFSFNEIRLLGADDINGGVVSVSMEDWADYIGIYNRYADANLSDIYTDPSLAVTDIFDLTIRDNDIIYEVREETDNYYIDLNLTLEGKSIDNDSILEKLESIIDEKYVEIKQLAEENEEYFYVVNMNVRLNTGEEIDGTIYDEEIEDIYYGSNSCYLFKTTKTQWENEFKKDLIEYLRGCGEWADGKFGSQFRYSTEEYILDKEISSHSFQISSLNSIIEDEEYEE